MYIFYSREKRFTSIISTDSSTEMTNTSKFSPKEGYRIVLAKIGIRETQE